MFKSLVCYTLVVVALDYAQGISDDNKAVLQSKFLEFGTACFKDHPLTDDDVASFKAKKFPDGENAGCFIGCVFKKIGIMDDQGSVSNSSALDHAKKIFDDEKDLKTIGEYISTCEKVNDDEVSDGEKGCERAKLTYNCLVENADKFEFNLDI